jgi:hypothetical protein
VTVPVNPDHVRSNIHLPSLLSNALVIYRVGATYAPDKECNITYNCLDSYYVRCSSHTESFSHHYSSTRRPQRSISTLSRTPDHYSCTRTPAHRSHRIHTCAASTLPYTPPRTAETHLCTCAWAGGVLSVARPLGTGTAVPGLAVTSLYGCYSALSANKSVGVRPQLLLFSRCSADSYSKLRCLACPNRSPYSRMGLYLGSW